MNCYLLLRHLTTTNTNYNKPIELQTAIDHYIELRTLTQVGVYIFHSKTEHTRFKHDEILISVCSGKLNNLSR